MKNPLLLPLSFLYGAGVKIRNYMFDTGQKKSVEFSIPVISTGNLSVGGTGKTPMAEYLLKLLIENGIKPGMVSRGYGRKTKGYYLLDEEANARNAGDEPYQVKKKFPGVPVAVAEDRIEGITHLLMQEQDTEAIVLDDAFQHRSVKPQIQILLTSYGKLYVDNYLLPYGRLREQPSGAKRADIIIVTKCPEDLSENEQEKIKHKLKPTENQQLFFSSISYGTLTSIDGSSIPENKLPDKEVLLFTGIENPEPLRKYVLGQKPRKFKQLIFRDHHEFNAFSMDNIMKAFERLGENKILLTTEKDFRRMEGGRFWDKFSAMPLYYLPIEMKILPPGNSKFDDFIVTRTQQMLKDYYAE